MAGSVPAIHAFRARCKDVDGREKWAFTPVFDGLCAAITPHCGDGPHKIATKGRHNLKRPVWPV